MTIQIHDHQTIGEVQKNFTVAFPFLRLAFFPPKGKLKLPSFDNEIPAGERLDKYLKEKAGELHISATDKVSTVEQNFRDTFALEVQVMRRSGNNWLMTTATDNYTLEQQNSLGIEMATTIANPEPEDIHEQE